MYVNRGYDGCRLHIDRRGRHRLSRALLRLECGLLCLECRLLRLKRGFLRGSVLRGYTGDGAGFTASTVLKGQGAGNVGAAVAAIDGLHLVIGSKGIVCHQQRS